MSKRELLLDFIGEEVSIITDMHTAVFTQEGDQAEVPYIAEGILLDYDDEYILLGSTHFAPPELVARDRTVSIKLSDKLEQVMQDPGKPKLGDMN